MQKKLVNFLLEWNKEQSRAFTSPDAALWRRQFRGVHQTEYIALKCMDGRLHLPVMTNTPPGIIQPFRNVGGVFDTGWAFFGELMDDAVGYAVNKGRDVLVLISYHYSKGNQYRGCRGFKYDVAAARQFTAKLVKEFEGVFGEGHKSVYPIQIGIETDDDALVLHGSNGSTMDLSEYDGADHDALRVKVRTLFPDMKLQLVEDLMPLVLGNIEHIREVRGAKRPVEDVEHREQVLAIGRGFDWLHLPNKALIVGPFSYNLGEPIATAAKILWENLRDGRIPKEEGVVLLSSAPYRDEAGPKPRLAANKAVSLARYSMEVIRREVPELKEHMVPLVGTMNMNSRLFTPIPFEG